MNDSCHSTEQHTASPTMEEAGLSSDVPPAESFRSAPSSRGGMLSPAFSARSRGLYHAGRLLASGLCFCGRNGSLCRPETLSKEYRLGR